MRKQARYSIIKGSHSEKMAGIYDNETGAVIVNNLPKKDANTLLRHLNNTLYKPSKRQPHGTF